MKSVGFFQQRMQQTVMARPEAQHVLAGNRAYCNKGRGPYDSALASVCYCICQAPMHYASFRAALDDRFGRTGADPLPNSPLVVDLGCGPGTTLFALCDWLADRRRTSISVAYIGIDISDHLLGIAAGMVEGAALFQEPSRFILRRLVDDLEDDDISAAASGRDGVIFALSYVLHHEFIHDMTLLAHLMRRVCRHTHGMPTWLLIQDANFPDRPDEHVPIWPEQRINDLANQCESLGYSIVGLKTKFVAPRIIVSGDGQFTLAQAGTTNNVCHFFQKIAG